MTNERMTNERMYALAHLLASVADAVAVYNAEGRTRARRSTPTCALRETLMLVRREVEQSSR